jgi:hypothetical protein
MPSFHNCVILFHCFPVVVCLWNSFCFGAILPRSNLASSYFNKRIHHDTQPTYGIRLNMTLMYACTTKGIHRLLINKVRQKTFWSFCILFIWTLSIVQFNKIHNVSETGSVSVFR